MFMMWSTISKSHSLIISPPSVDFCVFTWLFTIRVNMEFGNYCRTWGDITRTYSSSPVLNQNVYLPSGKILELITISFVPLNHFHYRLSYRQKERNVLHINYQTLLINVLSVWSSVSNRNYCFWIKNLAVIKDYPNFSISIYPQETMSYIHLVSWRKRYSKYWNQYFPGNLKLM